MTPHEKGKPTHKRGGHIGLDTILNLLINDTAITSNLRNISVAELLEKLRSDNFNQTVKLLILGLAISQILNKFVDFESLLLKPHSPSIKGDIMKDIFQKQKEAFINKYQIKKEDEVLLAEILKGTPLKLFEDEININHSTANKKIRRLWERLGLKNRAQLLYVAGRMKLVCYEPECIRSPEDQ